jgi:prolipoprotein diacylglyceryl transferase
MNASILGSLPSPSNSSISIGPLELRAYGVMIAFGVLAGVWLLGRRLEEKGLGTRDDASSISVWGVVAGIIGARLYHVATDWPRFSDNLGDIPKIWSGGLGIPGGLLAGIVVAAWQCHIRGIPIAKFMTAVAPALPLAQAIGRWGNWFNQELFGKATDVGWALEIDDAHLPAGFESGTTFHPTFLYESLWNLGLVGVLLMIDKKLRLGAGRLLAVYIMGYSLGRYWIEGLRIDPSRELAGQRWNQWVALAAIVGGALYLLITRGKKWQDEPAALDTDSQLDYEPAGAIGEEIEPDAEDADGVEDPVDDADGESDVLTSADE